MDFYIKEEDIQKELEKRAADKDLTKKIEEYLGDKIPEPFNDQNKKFAVLARHICTPDYELEKFLEKAKKLKLEPIIVEYLEDKFVSENEDKRALVKLYFFRGIFKNGEIGMDVFKIIDFENNKNKKIHELKTLWGESVVNFHHKIVEYFYLDIKNNIFDWSDWYHRHGENAKDYYQNFLALFIKNAVLFDNFRNHDYESSLVKDIFFPAFEKVENYFGIKPLIHPLQEIEDEDNPKWWGYDINKKDKIIEMSKNN